MKLNRLFRNVVLATTVTALASFGLGEWAMPDQNVPVDRLIANTSKAVSKHPKDIELKYLLGRLHSLAFALKSKKTDVYDSKGVPRLPAWSTIQTPREDTKSTPTKIELYHLARSLFFYTEVVKEAPNNALYKLGLGWMYEQAAPYAGKLPLGLRKKWPTTSLEWKKGALALYRKAYLLRRDQDIQGPAATHGVADAYIALESGRNILRLTKDPKIGSLSQVERKDIENTIAQLKDKRGAITPVIISLRPNADVSSLIDPNARVSFDLAGDGGRREWPWITPNAALLVWDPQQSGKITSGRQLFGNATFWMFYSDGYKALASLDNNHDGWLSGKELVGIGAWHDTNSNGKSDPGEVLSVQKMGITAIRTRAADVRNGMLWQSQGIRLLSGAYLPTYDWVPVSHSR